MAVLRVSGRIEETVDPYLLQKSGVVPPLHC